MTDPLSFPGQESEIPRFATATELDNWMIAGDPDLRKSYKEMLLKKFELAKKGDELQMASILQKQERTLLGGDKGTVDKGMQL